MSLNKPIAPCQRVVGKRLLIQNNRVAMDEKRISGFIQRNRSFDLIGPIKLAKFRMFIYLKMEHKVDKNRRNLYTSGKSRIWQLTRCIYFHSGDLSLGFKSQVSLKGWKWILLSLNKINWLDRTRFGMEIEIQHRKLINVKFWQYAYHVSKAHAQHKMVWEG